MEIVLPKLEVWQNEVFEKIKDARNSGKTFVIKSGRQRGKNFLINVLLIYYSMTYQGISILIEPTISQCGRVFNQLKDALSSNKLIKAANATTLTITLINDSQIIFKSAEQGNSLRGLTCSNILVIDEAAFINDNIIEILLPISNVNKCPVLFTSTPLFTEGYFYKMYEKGINSNKKVESFDWSLHKYDMSKYIDDETFKFYRENFSDMKFKTEILGEFIENGSAVFGDYQKCIMKDFDEKVCKYIGIDWASGTGNDETVITMMNENKEVYNIVSYKNKNPQAQISQIAALINKNTSVKKVMVEMNSIGYVYYDVLKNHLKNKMILEGYTTTNMSKRKMIEELIENFQNEKIKIPDNPTLIKELNCFVIKKLKNGGYTYENFSDSIHDDYVISLALCLQAQLSADNTAVSFGFQ